MQNWAVGPLRVWLSQGPRHRLEERRLPQTRGDLQVHPFVQQQLLHGAEISIGRGADPEGTRSGVDGGGFCRKSWELTENLQHSPTIYQLDPRPSPAQGAGPWSRRGSDGSDPRRAAAVP